jgi:alpha-L-fucosidase
MKKHQETIMKAKRQHTRGILLGTVAIAAMTAQAAAPADSRADNRLDWWRQARFGMFIHWGPVSLTGAEISWSRANSNPKCPNKGKIPVEVYDNLYKKFNPAKFNANEWARIARDAGMKYVVLTAKHCDGFLLWHSKGSQYSMAATPFQRDICRELADALHRRDLRVGWYYSPMDWRDPDFRTARNAAYIGRMKGQVTELLSNYGRIDLLWFDTDGQEAVYDQPATYRLVRTLQPDIIINNRLDIDKTGEHQSRKISPQADYYTPEQRIGTYDDQLPWETCMTLGTQWAWKPNDKIKSVPEVLAILAGCAGGDGNLLLNVGPMPDGRIEPRQVEVLQGVGKWLRQYGQSIYGTRGGPYNPGPYGASTRTGNTLYLHLLQGTDGGVILPPLPVRIEESALPAGGSVRVEQTDDALRIEVAPEHRQQRHAVVKLRLAGSAMGIAPIEIHSSRSKQQ